MKFRTTLNLFLEDEIISGLQKYIRRGIWEKALFCAYELFLSGKSKKLWGALARCAWEDIGYRRLCDICKLALAHEKFFQIFNQTKKEDVWKTPRLLEIVEDVLRTLCAGEKSKIAYFASIAPMDAEWASSSNFNVPLEGSLNERINAMLDTLDGPRYNIIRERIISLAGLMQYPSFEKEALLELDALLAISNETQNQYKVVSKTTDPLLTKFLHAEHMESISGLIWGTLFLCAEAKERNYIIKYGMLIIDYYIFYVWGAKTRVCIFAMFLAYFRGRQNQMKTVKLTDPLPVWKSTLFSKKPEPSDSKHISVCRTFWVPDGFILDRTTLNGRGTDTRKAWRKTITKRKLDKASFPKSERNRSHRPNPPATHATLDFCTNESWTLVPQSKEFDQYKAASIACETKGDISSLLKQHTANIMNKIFRL